MIALAAAVRASNSATVLPFGDVLPFGRRPVPFTRPRHRRLAVLLLLALVPSSPGWSQSKPTAPDSRPPARSATETKAKVPTALKPVASDPRSTMPAIPDDYKITLLIRTTIIAVNQANKTGNYSVLRDLGAPGFQSANTAAQLAESFGNQRKAKFDLSPILFFTPKLLQKPMLDEAGRLRVTGFFETKPQQVNFDLAFEYVDGEWRHFGLGIGTQLVVDPVPKRP